MVKLTYADGYIKLVDVGIWESCLYNIGKPLYFGFFIIFQHTTESSQLSEDVVQKILLPTLCSVRLWFLFLFIYLFLFLELYILFLSFFRTVDQALEIDLNS